jgi:ketosteroid isomerase-like protein
MSELDDFLATVVARQRAAEKTIHDGDPGPRLALWTKADPATLLGAAMPIVTGAAEVRQAFEQVASWFSDCTSYEFEVVAAGVSGDLAYTVGFEHTTTSVQGQPRAYTLRVTHVYRREDGEWHIVHRHADPPPTVVERELSDVLGGDDLAATVDRLRAALRRFIHGDGGPLTALFSTHDDVTLANPLGPARRGPTAVAATIRRAAANFAADGPLHFTEVSTTFDELSRVATPDLAYLVQVERHEGRVPARDKTVVVLLRTTMIFRREDGGWRIVHRHADPITRPRDVDSTVQ